MAAHLPAAPAGPGPGRRHRHHRRLHPRRGADRAWPPTCPHDLLAQALAAATAITDEYFATPSLAKALAGLAPHLPARLLAQALAAATAITRDYSRAEALTALAPHLPDPAAELLAQALAAATAITSDDRRAEALTALAPHLPEAQRPSVLAQALAAATATTNEQFRARALAAAGPPPTRRPAGQGAGHRRRHHRDYFRAEALTALAPYLPEAQRPSVLARRWPRPPPSPATTAAPRR